MRSKSLAPSPLKFVAQSGFTLIEIVVGIVVMAVALIGLSSVLYPQAKKSVNPVMEVKAAELAQALMNEILAKSYDHNSDHDGSRWRCGETITGITVPACTSSIGPEEPERWLYNDVDDYDTGGAYMSGSALSNSSGSSIGAQYPNFSVKIEVSYDTAWFGGATGKRIDLWVRLPQSHEIQFTAYRGNY